MNTAAVSSTVLCIALIIGLLFTVVNIVQLYNPFLTLVFCDVGQGDATYLRTPDGTDLLIDTGPDQTVLSCLGSSMPVIDRRIEYLILTHPDTDHIGAVPELTERYQIDHVLLPAIARSTDTYASAIDSLQAEGTSVLYLQEGDTIVIDDLIIDVLWPSVSFVHRSNRPSAITPEARDGEANEFSLVLLLRYHRHRALLMGDLPGSLVWRLRFSDQPVDLMTAPHHGSADGLTAELMQQTQPSYVIISAGRDNRYGHPHREVIALLEDYNVPYARTDLDGTQVFHLE